MKCIYFKLIIIILFFIGLGCSNKKTDLKNKELEVKEVKIDSVKITPQKKQIKAIEITKESGEEEYCYIKKIEKQKDKYYLAVDYVDFLMDEEAVEAAIYYGDADYEILESGDTSYFVYNDYYIDNPTSKLRTFELSDSAQIDIIIYNPNPVLKYGCSIKDIINREYGYKSVLYVLNIDSGIVKSIGEQYVP